MDLMIGSRKRVNSDTYKEEELRPLAASGIEGGEDEEACSKS